MPRVRPAASILILVLLLPFVRSANAEPLTEEDYDARARRVVPRDEFPVLFDPPLATAEQGDEALEADELVNDVCGDVPIAAAW